MTAKSRVVFGDAEIQAMLVARKRLGRRQWQVLRNPRARERGVRAEVSAHDDEGRIYFLSVRHPVRFPDKFSVVLQVAMPGSSSRFTLRRYNGPHGQHTNPLERETFSRRYHIHQATARYQRAGLAEDKYAEPSDRFSDWGSSQRMCRIVR